MDSQSKDLMLHAPLVKRRAHHVCSRVPANVEFDDLYQVGMVAVFEAVPRFDPTRGVQLRTFLVQRIMGAMLDELRANDPLSRSMRRFLRSLHSQEEQFRQQQGRTPRDSELADLMNLSLDDLNENKSRSLYTSVTLVDEDSEDERPHYVVSDESPEYDLLLKEILEWAEAKLSEREHIVFSYSLLGYTNQEIALFTGVSESRISQVRGAINAMIQNILRTGHPRVKQSRHSTLR